LGFLVSPGPFPATEITPQTDEVAVRIANGLAIDGADVLVGFAELTEADFAYSKCAESEITLPMTAIVISVRLASGFWLSAEVHPHEWHIAENLDLLFSYFSVFLLIGAVSVFFMHRMSRPLSRLTQATKRFANGLSVEEIEEDGPPDVRKAIRSFNAMQRQVIDEVARRAQTLAAISHDIRTPLTSLRIKAEMINDISAREDIIRSVKKMESITESALEFLRKDGATEALVQVDLTKLLADECEEFRSCGEDVAFSSSQQVLCDCKPSSLLRAVRNLIENALKYGGNAKVAVQVNEQMVEITVSDTGPGMSDDDMRDAVEPFRRLSAARESDKGGFGLGLAIAESIAQDHGGELILSQNSPSGTVATIRLPQYHVARGDIPWERHLAAKTD
jgi:signal transduction histidine kinase